MRFTQTSNSKAQGDNGSITYTDNLFKTAIHTCNFVSKKSRILFSVYIPRNGKHTFSNTWRPITYDRTVSVRFLM